MSISRRRRLASLEDQIARRPDPEAEAKEQQALEMYFQLMENTFSRHHFFREDTPEEYKERYCPRHPRETIRAYQARVMGMSLREWNALINEGGSDSILRGTADLVGGIVIHSEMKNTLCAASNEMIERLLWDREALKELSEEDCMRHDKAIEDLVNNWEKRRRAS